MKNHKKSLLLLSVLVGGIFFWQGSSLAKEDMSLEMKFDELITQLKEISGAILQPRKEINSWEGVTDTKAVPAPVGNSNGCVSSGYGDKSYLLWESSFVRKNNMEWDSAIFPSIYANQEIGMPRQLADINGDGLIDYISIRRSYVPSYSPYYDNGVLVAGYLSEESCVALNNGTGWDIVFRCVVDMEQIPDTSTYNIVYYGDCADMSK